MLKNANPFFSTETTVTDETLKVETGRKTCLTEN